MAFVKEESEDVFIVKDEVYRPAKLRVILQEHDIRKLELPRGIPGSVRELEAIVMKTFGLEGSFTLHYRDADFQDYFSLTSTSEIQDRDTIKVIHILDAPSASLSFSDHSRKAATKASFHPAASSGNVSFMHAGDDLQPSRPSQENSFDPHAITLSFSDEGSPCKAASESSVLSPDSSFMHATEIHPCSSAQEMIVSCLSDVDRCVKTEPDPSFPLLTCSASASGSFLSTAEGSPCSSSQEMIFLSPEHTTSHRSQRWPAEFPVPRFALDTELVLVSGADAFKKNGSQLNFTSILPDVLEKLAESIFQYTAYPTGAQLSQVVQALLQKHPCLKEPGAYNGSFGWSQRLKYKMGNYRCKLRGLGCPELDVNAIRAKRDLDKAPAKNIKKPRKMEVNFLPPHPLGVTQESLERKRRELLDEQQSDPLSVREKMERTFSLRRQEVVTQALSVRQLKERWPALFTADQINEEFRRITTLSLEETFISRLDQYTPKVISMVLSKAGSARISVQRIRNMLMENFSLERRREASLRSLMVLLRENEDDLFREQMVDGGDSGSMRILISSLGRARIVLEGVEVQKDLDVPRACALLMGLIYSLNLSYPKEMKSTFEAFQKILLELDDLRNSPKIMSLKNKLQY